ncbi:HNH endonuclease [bacterium]|nr:HNH endonuclease [bacterium]
MAVSPSSKALVRDRAQGLCEYCHASEDWQFVAHTMDHIVPQSAGGADTIENLALACFNCNTRRQARTECVVDGNLVPLFNPRTDRWNDHFAWSHDALSIVALTEVGRGTRDLLDFNGERHGTTDKLQRIRAADRSNNRHPPQVDRVWAN